MKNIRSIIVEDIILEDGKNHIKRFIDDLTIFHDVVLISTSPFTFNSDEGKVFVTNNNQETIPDDCKYALLNSRKSRKKDFESSSFNFIAWLRHPKIVKKNTEYIRSSWAGNFTYKKEDPTESISGLRAPQIGAIHAVMAHMQNADENAIVVLPTGTGKTETMISVMLANQCKKVLVSVPSDSLRTQISDSFSKLGILKDIGVVPQDTLNPIVGVIGQKFKSIKEYQDFVSKCNVVITTMQILTGLPQVLRQKCADDFSHYFVDEAHHSEAPTWRSFIENFPLEKVFLFTATPFRNDNRKMKGKIVFNFSLKKAQEQGYYEKINFIPIREYDIEDADKLIAQTAVEQLKKDRDSGLDHILMARCKSKHRAEEIYEYYKKYQEYNPVVVYNGKAKLNKTLKDIKSYKHQIIICVDMLGEGFNLPELKLAAIHDARQSIPIMLQFIGRFTRTSSRKIGEATFITNTAYPPIKKELNDLYNLGNDWNVLLPQFSDGITQSQLDFNELLAGFQGTEESKIPFHSIHSAMSAIVYNNTGTNWNPDKWREGIKGINSFTHQFSDVNDPEKLLVIILGKESDIDWMNYEDAKNLSWDMILIHWDYRPKQRNQIFIHSSMKSLNTDLLLKKIFGPNVFRYEGEKVFRVLDKIQRYTIHNFGGRKGIGRDISFQSFFGKNIENGLHQLEQKKLEKNNVFGIGYREGKMISMGCSQKGKIWSYLRGNIKDYIHWCQGIGTKLLDESIDTDMILSHTMKSYPITERPLDKIPIYVDWYPRMYEASEGKFFFTDSLSGKGVDLAGCELSVIDSKPNENLSFKWCSDFGEEIFELELGKYTDEEGIDRASYLYKHVSGLKINVEYGNKLHSLEEFFQENSPVIYFHDTSHLYKSNYRSPKDSIPQFNEEQLFELDWSGVDLSRESMGFINLDKTSIQYNFIERIKNKYDLIYNDDNAGEMADIVAIRKNDDLIEIDLFHLKFASGGVVSGKINNFYEVCGQTQKSLKWVHSERKYLFDHLFKRLKNKKRIIKGSKELLENIQGKALWEMEIKFNIAIVQPGLIKSKLTNDIKTLLATTSYFLKTTADVNLDIYINKE